MKIGVVTFPGSNCDYDCLHAVEDTMGAEAVYLWHAEADLRGSDAVFLPGGFSYGDYLRAGAIARVSPIMDEVRAFAEAGGPVAGICNGFQILCEAGLLPGGLIRNRSLRFASRSVRLRVEATDSFWTSGYQAGQLLRVPIAHGEGCYVADEATLDALETSRRVAFRYMGEASPNGSARNIAGIVSEAGNVLGMMPHPERAVDESLGSTDGVGLFRALENYLNAGVSR
ncbi:phosphoribosylformylglycinamidine synthase subunit PurQ [soil metagenome]